MVAVPATLASGARALAGPAAPDRTCASRPRPARPVASRRARDRAGRCRHCCAVRRRRRAPGARRHRGHRHPSSARAARRREPIVASHVSVREAAVAAWPGVGGALGRDVRLALRSKAELGVQLLFYVIVVTLFPLGVGAEPQLLGALGPGVLWVAALLASLLSLPRLFAADFTDGTL